MTKSNPSDDQGWTAGGQQVQANARSNEEFSATNKQSASCRVSGFALGANDGPVDDFLEMVDGWEALTGQSLTEELSSKTDAGNPSSTRDMLERISSDFSPEQMRHLGGSLLKLADALDQAWSPSRVRSTYHSISHAGRIEKNSLQLAQVAMRLREQAKRRSRFISAEFLGEPAWEMLLELFVQFAGKSDISTKSLCIVSGLPETSAHRLIDRLEDACLIERRQSSVDKRVMLVRLTKQGIIAAGSILAEFNS
jgi:hypothetical protein